MEAFGEGQVMSISNMIDMIRRRPGMFLGGNSISALEHYLNGYQAAERDYAIYRDRRGELFPLSFRYMHAYTGYRLHNSDNMGWRHLILNACGGEEEAALQKFFELYDEFRQIGMKRYWKAVLSEDNIAWNDQMKRVRRCAYTDERGNHVMEPVYRNPLAVYVVELTICAWILAVETADNLHLETRFFASPEKAKGAGMFPEGAEVYFGPIDSWEEFSTQSISFDKNFVF